MLAKKRYHDYAQRPLRHNISYCYADISGLTLVIYNKDIAKQDVFATCLSTLCTRYESVSTNLQLRSDGINWNDAQLQRLLPPQDCNDISTIQGSLITTECNNSVDIVTASAMMIT